MKMDNQEVMVMFNSMKKKVLKNAWNLVISFYMVKNQRFKVLQKGLKEEKSWIIIYI